MTRNLFCILAILGFLLLPVQAKAADAEELRAEFWIDPGIILFADLRASAFEGGEGGMSELTRESYRDQAVQYLLEQARWTFSVMIYGYRFRYTPSDTERGVAEIFEIEPVYLIPWGDPRIRVVRSEEIDGRLYVVLSCRLDRSQQVRVRGWKSSVFPSTGGTGSVPIQDDFCTLRAMEQGIKESIRNYLRPILFNKPKSVTGIAVLRAPPDFFFDAGDCRVNVRVKLKIEEIRPRIDP
jgi:hypothetical protein